MTRKSIFSVFSVKACVLAFWPWFFVALPLTVVFEPLRRIVGHSPGFLSKLTLVLLGIAECIGSYLIFVVVIHIMSLYIVRKYITKIKGKDSKVLKLEDAP